MSSETGQILVQPPFSPEANSELTGEVIKSSSGYLCGRTCCPYWRMTAGVLALAASIIAVVCAVIWNTPWLILPFGLGGLGSGYATYLGYEYHHLQTLEESNKILQSSLEYLNEQNAELSTQVETLQNTNQKLQETAKNLGEEAMRHKEANEQQSLENQTLKEQNKELEKLYNQFNQQSTTHVKNLQTMQNSLSGIQSAAKSNHETFGQKLEVFNLYLSELGTTTGTATEQTTALLQAGRLLQETFQEIQTWKSEEKIQQQISKLQKASIELAKIETQSQHLAVQVKGLESIKNGLETQINTLTTETGNLGKEVSKLKKVSRTFSPQSSPQKGPAPKTDSDEE